MNTDPSGLRFAPDEGLAEQGGGYGRTEDLTPDDGFDAQAYYSPQNEEVYPDPDPDPTPPAANGDPTAAAAPPAASATPTPGHSAAPTSTPKAEQNPGVPGSNAPGNPLDAPEIPDGTVAWLAAHGVVPCVSGALSNVGLAAHQGHSQTWQEIVAVAATGCVWGVMFGYASTNIMYPGEGVSSW